MRIDVDSKQRISSAGTFCLEFYKVLMGTFLTIFVPHACGDRMCSFSHNLYENDDLFHQLAVGTNALCFSAFIYLYVIEIRRENWCITHLDMDTKKPIENLDTEIERYPQFKQRMMTMNKKYENAAIICYFAHAINLIVSISEILGSWPGTPAMAPLVSYVILVTMKLYGSKQTASASLRSERALSAYLSGPRSYNTIDKDHRIFEEQPETVEVEVEN
mgnify:CR=1 FL=1